MSETVSDLGKLVSVHGTSPAFLQRAAIVSILSFVFFLIMLLAFYLRQQIGYFVLSTAFLVVYLFTMIGWWMQKRNVVNIYENGISYRKFKAAWDDLEPLFSTDNGPLEIRKKSGEKISVRESIDGLEHIAETIRARMGTWL